MSTGKPRMLSLFSGIGGIDLAWEMAGGEIAGQVEIDPFCQQVLARHWPKVRRIGDIRKVWGDTFSGSIDLVAGGFPCQPFSVAGARRGANDDRFLWPEMRRVIEIYQPAWVLGENVSGFIGLALDDVCADLERAGYEVGALVLPAAAVGAPHQRERVFIVAHTRCAGQSTGGIDGGTATLGTLSHNGARGEGAPVADAACGARRGATCRDGGLTLAGDTRYGWQTQSYLGREPDGLSRRLDGDRRLAYPYQPWPAGPGQAQHEWEVPRTTQERIPNRAARLKALGNAVVPQQVYPILAAIIEQWRHQ